MDTQSSLRQPVATTGTTCFFHYSLTLFLMLASDCPRTSVPCSTSSRYEKKIPTPSMNHHDAARNQRYEILVLKGEKKKILKYSLGCSSERHIGRQAIKTTHCLGHTIPEGTAGRSRAARALQTRFCCQAENHITDCPPLKPHWLETC